MPKRIDYASLETEQPNPRSAALDRLSIERTLRLINREDALVPRAVQRVLPSVARAVRLIVSAWQRGGRLVFLGAGTSGRLGVIEAAECPPTFNTPPGRIRAIMAGGPRAVFRSREGAEDNRRAAREAVRRRVCRGDVVVGIAASGITPFVEAGLQTAHACGAATILVSCQPHTSAKVDGLITPHVGPEIIAGSTRLKAGTATKLILNLLTVASMVQLGKVHGPWMVDVRPTSRKLAARAVRMIGELAAVDERRAKRALRQADGDVKVAIVIAALHLDQQAARTLLARHRGQLRQALAGNGHGRGWEQTPHATAPTRQRPSRCPSPSA